MHVVFSTVAEGYRQMLTGDKKIDTEKIETEFRLKLNWLKSGAAKEITEKNE